MPRVMQYVVTPKTNTGYAVYYCEVEYTARTRKVRFKNGKRIAGGGVPNMKFEYYRYPYVPTNEYIFDDERYALSKFIALSSMMPKPKSVLRQKALAQHVKDAVARLTQLPDIEEPIEEDLKLTDEQLRQSIEVKPPAKDAKGR